MKLLLDAHNLLWLVAGDPKLSTQAKASIADPANDLFLSVGSIWELAIKTTKPKQKLELSEPLKTYLVAPEKATSGNFSKLSRGN